MQTIKDFITKNWVFISGLLAAIAVVLQQFLTQTTIEIIPVLIAVGIAILSYIANEWRGKGVTVLGIIGTLAYVFVQVFTGSGGKIDWKQLILLFLLAIITAVCPPPKPNTYEKSAVITEAKDQAAVITKEEKAA